MEIRRVEWKFGSELGSASVWWRAGIAAWCWYDKITVGTVEEFKRLLASLPGLKAVYPDGKIEEGA